MICLCLQSSRLKTAKKKYNNNTERDVGSILSRLIQMKVIECVSFYFFARKKNNIPMQLRMENSSKQPMTVDLAIATKAQISHFSMRKMVLRNAVVIISAWGCCFRIVVCWIWWPKTNENMNYVEKTQRKLHQKNNVRTMSVTWSDFISWIHFEMNSIIDRITFMFSLQFIQMSIWISIFRMWSM